MAYKNSSSKKKMTGMKYGYNQGNMMAHVGDIQKPKKCYAQKYDQAPLNYIKRQDRRQVGEASKLRREAYHGKYSR